MYILLVMLVTFFIVAISSWWLDDFGDADDEPQSTPNSLPVTTQHEPSLTLQKMPTTAGD